MGWTGEGNKEKGAKLVFVIPYQRKPTISLRIRFARKRYTIKISFFKVFKTHQVPSHLQIRRLQSYPNLSFYKRTKASLRFELRKKGTFFKVQTFLSTSLGRFF